MHTADTRQLHFQHHGDEARTAGFSVHGIQTTTGFEDFLKTFN